MNTPSSQAPNPPNRQRRARAWLRFGFAVLGMAVFVWLLERSDPPHVAAVLGRMPMWVIFALCFFPLGIALDGLAWQRLLLRLGARVHPFSAFVVRLGSEAIGSSLPLGGLGAEAVGPVLLARRAGVPTRSTIASSLAKRWLTSRAHGTYVLLCVGLAAVVGWLPGLRADVVIATALALLAASALTQATAAHARPADRVRAILSRLPFVGGVISSKKAEFDETDAEMSILARTFSADAYALVLLAWIVEGLETFVFLRAVGVSISLPAALALDGTMSALRSAAVVVPSGLGVQDLGYAAALGATPTTAAFLVLKRAKELVYVAVGYGILFWLGGEARAAGHGAPPSRHGLAT